jgi:AcrR family transcriptional regulator
MDENTEHATRLSRAESKQATRKALLEAGLAELIEHGLDVPSLDSICARAGYTRGAFYVHFKDRGDFFVAVLDWILTGVLNAVTGEHGELSLRDAIDNFGGYLQTGEWPMVGKFPFGTHRVAEAIARSPLLRERWCQVYRESVARMAKLVERAQSEGEVRRSLNPQHVAELVITLGIGSMGLLDMGIALSQSQLGAGIWELLES